MYIPQSKQDDQPLFDFAPYDTNFDSLFREFRFSGIDRVQNANQLTMALTTRLIDGDSGRERLKLSVGDIVYFEDRQAQSAQLSEDPASAQSFGVETNRFSNIISELKAGN